MLKTHRPLTVVALLLAMFMAAMEATVVGTAMPTVVGDLGGLALYPWVGSGYMLATTVSVPAYGKIADLYGRKRLLTFGIVLFLIGSIASGFAQNMGQLIAFRTLQGLGAGAMQPIALTVIGDIFTIEERGKIQGLFGAVWGISGIVGPLLGGVIVHALSWHWVFWINIPFGAASLVILSRAFHEERQKKNDAPFDWTGAIMLTVGSSLLLLGASGEYPAFNLPIGVALLVGFAFVEHRALDPVLPLDLVRLRPILIASISGILLGATMTATLNLIPLYAQGVLGRSPTEAGAAVAAMLVGWPISSALTSRLLTRTGFRPPVWLGSVVILASLAAFAALLEPNVSIAVIQVSMFFYGAGMGLTNTALLIAVQSSVEWKQRGVATATNMFSRSMGGTLGWGALGGLMAATSGSALTPEKASALLNRHEHGAADVSPELIEVLGNAIAPLFWVIAALALFNLIAVAFYPRTIKE